MPVGDLLFILLLLLPLIFEDLNNIGYKVGSYCTIPLVIMDYFMIAFVGFCVHLILDVMNESKCIKDISCSFDVLSGKIDHLESRIGCVISPSE